ncbi:MAG TPA: NADH-ubiquinone oxidoreductase-F iron-sulfur binding region domain-containing protein, partial [Dehalococcoidia bacterium]|nr:NADH-ubiquinone oxidoreductase-F iron-sulfur binding region domain-containing protein [Dehalococcoidia bacterium]
PGGPRVIYQKVTPALVDELLRDVVAGGRVRADLALFVWGAQDFEGVPALETSDFWRGQERRLMRRFGQIDPENIDHYLATGGYEAFYKALTAMQPEEITTLLKDAGLTGKGGANFPAGVKWDFLRTAAVKPKYVICNADEGDAGAWVNREILEGDPHLLIEGMAIGSYVMGAEFGYVYIRNEYPLAIARVEKAIRDAEDRGILGDDCLGTGVKCRLQVYHGHGSYLCGEETALMESIEGRRGMPRIKPPFPAQAGVFGKPSNINNVETYANAPDIVLNGKDWYRSLGSEKAPGTKMFSLSGSIERTCVVEVPYGVPLTLLIDQMAGGVPAGHTFKALQPGGPLGGVVDAETARGLTIEPPPFQEAGVLLGSGGFIVLDERTCMIDISRYFSAFCARESCTRCTTCRIGGMYSVDVLKRIQHGGGKPADIAYLGELEESMRLDSYCVHGKNSPIAIATTLRYFKQEYEEHIYQHHCRAGVCSFASIGLIQIQPMTPPPERMGAG